MINVKAQDQSVTIKLDLSNGAFALYDQWYFLRIYSPSYLTFHAPSEHTFEGQHYDLEMQVYHKEQNSENYVAYSIFFDQSQEFDKTQDDFITTINPSQSN